MWPRAGKIEGKGHLWTCGDKSANANFFLLVPEEMSLTLAEQRWLVQLSATCHRHPKEGQSPTLWQGLEPVQEGAVIFRDSSTPCRQQSPESPLLLHPWKEKIHSQGCLDGGGAGGVHTGGQDGSVQECRKKNGCSKLGVEVHTWNPGTRKDCEFKASL